MKHKQFIAAIDDAQVIAAIRAAETKTSSEFRVFVSNRTLYDPIEAARKQFARLKMHRTRHRNAVLIFVAPKSRNFAIFADSAARERCERSLWERMAAEMGAQFKQQAYTSGLVNSITALGDALHEYFPAEADSGNELRDTIERD